MSDSPFDLRSAARQEMIAEGFEPDFPKGTPEQIASIQAHPPAASGDVQDLRALLWSSIDNDTSRDLDQAEVAETVEGGIRVRVAVADVTAAVAIGTPIDQHAQSVTTSVYTGIRTFPMLPEELSTDLTSLNENQDRLAIVVDYVVDKDGNVSGDQIYRALVRNQAQLAYNGVGAWLDGSGPAPAKVAASGPLQAQLKLQDQAAQLLHDHRSAQGALTLGRTEAEAILNVVGNVEAIQARKKNRATDLIENFMVAANGVMARALSAAGVSSIRRIVRTPERWPRIMELAARLGTTLPPDPDSGALNAFLQQQLKADPVHFEDLSLAVVKLMGPGEYVLVGPHETDPGHFALAARDYTHSTAPNRRFSDTVTQRLIKAVFLKQPSPYTNDQLSAIARNCTEKEDAARKVERVMGKRIAAVAMHSHIGEVFPGVITGVTPKGTFVRVINPPAEGLLIHGEEGVDVGDQLKVRLVSTDPRRGYIDFARA